MVLSIEPLGHKRPQLGHTRGMPLTWDCIIRPVSAPRFHRAMLEYLPQGVGAPWLIGEPYADFTQKSTSRDWSWRHRGRGLAGGTRKLLFLPVAISGHKRKWQSDSPGPERESLWSARVRIRGDARQPKPLKSIS